MAKHYNEFDEQEKQAIFLASILFLICTLSFLFGGMFVYFLLCDWC